MKRRILYILSSFFLCFVLFQTWNGNLSKYVRICLFERHLQLAGNKFLSWEEIAPLLPKGSSNLWWYYNLPELSVRLSRHPLVEEATIEPCSPGLSWACFSISLKERIPRLRVLLRENEWLADEQGVLLTVIPQKVQNDHFKNLPLVYGLLGDSLSTDEAQARLRFVTESLLQLQAETGRYVNSIQFLNRGEMRVYFEGLNFPVRFGSPLSLQPGGLPPLPLIQQVHRMEDVLGHIPGDREVQELDLGFNSLAILR